MRFLIKPHKDVSKIVPVTRSYDFGSWPATKDHTVALSPLPPLGWEENGKKKAKLMGWDKGSLTQQQIK